MPITWRPNMSVGNDTIDADHKQLLGLINAAESALGPDGDRVSLNDALARLDAYTKEHFAREELLMKTVRYPRYVDHRIAHRNLSARLVEISALLRESKAGTTTADEAEKLSQLLRSWLIDHVLKEDLLYKPALRDLPADYKP